MIQFFTKQMKKTKNKKGFTLIELIIVIAILAILALIALPRLGGFRQDAVQSRVDADAALIYRAAESAYASGRIDGTDMGDFDYEEYLDDVQGTVTYDGTPADGDLEVTVDEDGVLGIYPRP